MSGLHKTIFCIHWLQKFRESFAYVFVFADILWSCVHVQEIIIAALEL